MRLASRAATLAALALLFASPVTGAHAQANNWKTLSTVNGGKIQACKVPTTASGPWKVRLRVDARTATSRVHGTAFVAKGSVTLSHWKSGWVAKGQVSGVGVLKLPGGAAYSLNAGIATANAGNGGSFTAGQIRVC